MRLPTSSKSNAGNVPTIPAKAKEQSNARPFADDHQRLLHYAELRFQKQGGGRCAVCSAHVRHVLRVISLRPEGSKEFACLCTRCLVAEEARSPRVLLRINGLSVDSPGSRQQRDAA